MTIGKFSAGYCVGLITTAGLAMLWHYEHYTWTPVWIFIAVLLNVWVRMRVKA